MAEEFAEIIAENCRQREALAQCGARLSAAELERLLPNGWRVADVFFHLAFWDWRQREVLLAWAKSGDFSPIIADNPTVNAALLRFSEKIPVTLAPQMAVEAAEASDASVAALSPELAARILAVDERVLRRSLHREHHLKQLAAL